MKFYGTVITLLLFFITATFINCKSREKKLAEERENNAMAEAAFIVASSDTIVDAEEIYFAEEWKLFKAEKELEIRNNDTRIESLKMQMKAARVKSNFIYNSKIDTLYMRNLEMKRRISGYNNSKTSWQMFKREISSDMSKLGKALQSFSIDNVR